MDDYLWYAGSIHSRGSSQRTSDPVSQRSSRSHRSTQRSSDPASVRSARSHRSSSRRSSDRAPIMDVEQQLTDGPLDVPEFVTCRGPTTGRIRQEAETLEDVDLGEDEEEQQQPPRRKLRPGVTDMGPRTGKLKPLVGEERADAVIMYRARHARRAVLGRSTEASSDWELDQWREKNDHSTGQRTMVRKRWRRSAVAADKAARRKKMAMALRAGLLVWAGILELVITVGHGRQIWYLFREGAAVVFVVGITALVAQITWLPRLAAKYFGAIIIALCAAVNLILAIVLTVNVLAHMGPQSRYLEQLPSQDQAYFIRVQAVGALQWVYCMLWIPLVVESRNLLPWLTPYDEGDEKERGDDHDDYDDDDEGDIDPNLVLCRNIPPEQLDALSPRKRAAFLAYRQRLEEEHAARQANRKYGWLHPGRAPTSVRPRATTPAVEEV